MLGVRTLATIGIFYGRTTGAKDELAEHIRAELGADVCALYRLASAFAAVAVLFPSSSFLLVCSPWGAGEVQNDWRDPLFDMEVEKPDLSGKTIALFGPGDCTGHGKHFVGALGILHDVLKSLGATIVGAVSTEDYSFEQSTAIRNGKFVGLPLDNVNESDKTDQRIADWLELLKTDFPVLAS